MDLRPATEPWRRRATRRAGSCAEPVDFNEMLQFGQLNTLRPRVVHDALALARAVERRLTLLEVGATCSTSPRPRVRPALRRLVAERPEARAQLLREELRLFPSREMPALLELVVVDELRIGALCPALRCWTDLIRKDAHCNRDGDAFDTQIRELVLPVQTRPGKRRVRQPGERDVVEDVVACETGSFSRKDA